MLFNAIGGVSHYAIYPSTIRSKKRLDPSVVASILATPTNDWLGSTIQFLDILATMSGHTLLQLVPDVPSFKGYKPTLGSPNRVANIVEIAMIWANITVSSHLRSRGVRIPNLLYSNNAVTSELYTTAGPVLTRAGAIQQISRTSAKMYDGDRRGHEGISVTDYTHFTSPMRRDADATVHKILAGQFNPGLLDARIKRINHRKNVLDFLVDLSATWSFLRKYIRGGVTIVVNITEITRIGIKWEYSTKDFTIENFTPNANITLGRTNPRKKWKASLTLTAINVPLGVYTSRLTNFRP
jgi:hypothetical protein